MKNTSFVYISFYYKSMFKKLILSIFLLLPFLVVSQDLSDEELKLYTMINDYRNSKGLKNIPISKSLTFVAQTHVRDLMNNKPYEGANCNIHSWSNKGDWTPCCYTSNHARAKCMWDKPKELTSYKGTGFEISTRTWSEQIEIEITAEKVLQNFKGSSGHNSVIINQGKWHKYKWNAIGIGIYKEFAVVWFGKEKDEN